MTSHMKGENLWKVAVTFHIVQIMQTYLEYNDRIFCSLSHWFLVTRVSQFYKVNSTYSIHLFLVVFITMSSYPCPLIFVIFCLFFTLLSSQFLSLLSYNRITKLDCSSLSLPILLFPQNAIYAHRYKFYILKAQHSLC